MAISTYVELKTAVANWLARADLTDTIPDLITLGELRIFREVRCQEMEAALSSTIANGVIAVPTDCIELKDAQVYDGGVWRQLTRTTVDQVYSRFPLRSSDAVPRVIARERTNFIFGPYPDGDYSVQGTYYAQPTGIATSVNDLFLAYPDLYLWAALCEAAPFIQNDARLQLWEGKYAMVKGQMAFKEFSESSGGSGLAVVAA